MTKKLIRSLIFGKINIFNVFFVDLSGIYRRADGIVFSGRIYYSIMIWVRKIIRYSFYRVAYDVANVTQKSWGGGRIKLMILPHCALFFQHKGIALLAFDSSGISIPGTIDKFTVNYSLELFFCFM